MSPCSEMYHITTTTILSYVRIMYPSTFRLSEVQLPHDTIIPDHDE